jgi:hypothetical protein
MSDAIETDDWDRRQLCPDGSCVGVIGPDGECSVCGTGAAADAEAPQADDEALEAADEAPEADDDADDADDDRELCPDGTCVGLIGADGTCKVCGARARG